MSRCHNGDGFFRLGTEEYTLRRNVSKESTDLVSPELYCWKANVFQSLSLNVWFVGIWVWEQFPDLDIKVHSPDCLIFVELPRLASGKVA